MSTARTGSDAPAAASLHGVLRRLLPAVAAAALVGAVACSKSETPPEGAGATTTAPTRTSKTVVTEVLPENKPIQVLDNRFYPEGAVVSSGRTVSFENDGRNDHNVLPFDDGAFAPVQTDAFHPGDKATVTFAKPGTYKFYCSVHGNRDAGMVGTIVVR